MKDYELYALGCKLMNEDEAKALRKTLKAGETYEIDTTVHIKGIMKVGHPYPKAPTTNLSMKKALALLLKHAALPQDAMKKFLADSLQTLLKEGEIPGVGAIEMQAIDEVIATLPDVTCNGQVKAKLLVSQLIPVEGKLTEEPQIVSGHPLKVEAA